uniref:Moesin/ezrin/radixin homolog 1 n=1 Tax=Rhabditophanes sp. KR3021 TaxID=114890 RepID=A0AC35TZT8_9BILA
MVGGGFFRSLSQRLTNRRTVGGESNRKQTITTDNGKQNTAMVMFGSSKDGGRKPLGTKKGYEVMDKKFDKKKEILCQVKFLDGTTVDFVLNKKCEAKELYDHVYYTLDLDEQDYFGLTFVDSYRVQNWLDPLKKIPKQVNENGVIFKFSFRVKFFSSEPSNLREELTKYQFFLQLKNDIQIGKLECDKSTAIDLAGYAIQSECGDYDSTKHSAFFVSEFRFHPEQDEEMEIGILEKFKRCKGQSPAQAEMNFLNRAKELQMYGVDTHMVQGKDGNKYKLGLTPTGMVVADGEQMIGFFRWEFMQKLNFAKKRITLVVEDHDSTVAKNRIQLHTFVFNLNSHKACKHLWKSAIEFHTFYRLKFHRSTRGPKTQLFRLGSTFKYRGKTEYENVHREQGRLSRRTTSTFERRPSQRYNPRQSHARIGKAKVLPPVQEKATGSDGCMPKSNSGSPISHASSGYISSHNLSQSLTHLHGAVSSTDTPTNLWTTPPPQQPNETPPDLAKRKFQSAHDLLAEDRHITTIEISAINKASTPVGVSYKGSKIPKLRPVGVS